MARFRTKIDRESRQKIAKYYVENDSTIRKTAKYFGIPKTYVHKALEEFQMDRRTAGSELALKVRAQIRKNTKERAKRGGAATRAKYANMKK